MTIAFVHHDKAFLPALNFYPLFFSKYGIKCEVVTKNELNRLNRDIEWFFMGIDTKKPQPGIFKIHEYISPSVPPLRNMKDRYKRIFNVRPAFRIFKNSYVRECFDFNDNIPFCYQDVGIPEEWLNPSSINTEKKFDFIYIGDLSYQRNPGRMLEAFTRPDLHHRSIVILSNNYSGLRMKYKAYKNIIFKGPVPKSEIPAYLQQSRFAINYIPDKEPFNLLTSTKLLEYAANKIPVITSDYKWMRAFERDYGGKYYYLKDDFSNLVWQELNEFQFAFPDLTEWTWESQIKKSGALKFLSSIFPDIKW